MDGLRSMALGQGVALIGLGAWPLVSMRTFELVTGPKHDDWLVRTVGGLCVAIGTGLVAGSRQGEAVRPLGVATAATFLAADVIGVASGRLRPVYLLDAVAEAALIGGWAAASAVRRRRRSWHVRRAAGRRDESAGRGQSDTLAADPEAMRAHVAALLEEARHAVERTWPGSPPPPPVRESLERLERAAMQLETATGDGSAEPIGSREHRRLAKLAANASIDAASVKEAAYLVSS